VGKTNLKKHSVLAIAAHPDDIEFQMGGTLLLLGQAGCETHYFNIANGCYGSVKYDTKTTRKIRAVEGREAARILGAKFYPSLADDLKIFYDLKTLQRVAAVIREAKPTIILTHPPQDYMEDHTNACRLAATAAFTHAMPNFKTLPPRATYEGDIAIYHCMPHGLRDGLRRRVLAGAYVNTTSVHQKKLKALAAHRSQQNWLDVSQGMNSYLRAMEEMSRELGRMSGKFKYAEGWRRHLHLGFSAKEVDPLAEILGKNCLINKKYERDLERGF
jgi:LmbE family N-acetylglucosaminyl deacetylase